MDYKPPYPINVIITPSSLEKYNRLFVFLLRILRMGVVSRHIYRLLHDRYLIDDKDTVEDKNLAQKFRFEAQQFISALQGYAFDVAVSSTWSHFEKYLKKVKKELKFQLTREHSYGASPLDSQSDSFSTDFMDDIEENNDVDTSECVRDLASLRAYHNHVLDRMLFQCLLLKEQEPITENLDRIQILILEFAKDLQIRRSRTFDVHMRFEYWRKIKNLYAQFRLHVGTAFTNFPPPRFYWPTINRNVTLQTNQKMIIFRL
ncbi:6487_t:CDS:1 [Dentiscutata erythropus]|uniref:Spindle pole body component n=1 Tax=Dentiscutata erythropus TaxID=1348616 RepID=A0A9N9HXL4_9GLOM|nr:6487_t:CDS:1 [Dentiscutata erythropus]